MSLTQSESQDDWGMLIVVMVLVTVGAILLRIVWLVSLCFRPVHRRWRGRTRRVRSHR